MKVRDLIEQLQGWDGDMEVHFAYSYGDHWRTQMAPKVSFVQEGSVIHSDYHNKDMLVDDDYEGDKDREVVVIS